LLRQRIIQRMCTLRDSRCINAILNIYRRQFVDSCTDFITTENNGNNSGWRFFISWRDTWGIVIDIGCGLCLENSNRCQNNLK